MQDSGYKNNVKFRGYKNFFKYINDDYFDSQNLYKITSHKFLKIILFLANSNTKNSIYKKVPRKIKILKEYYNFISKVVLDYIIEKGELSLEKYKLDSIMNIKISPSNITSKNGYVRKQYKDSKGKIYSYPSEDVFVIYPKYKNKKMLQSHKQYFSSHIAKGKYLKVVRKELDRYFNNEPIKYFDYAIYKRN